MGKEHKDDRRQDPGKSTPKPKPDLTPGRQVPAGGEAPVANAFSHSPLGIYLMHKAMAQDLKKERQVDLAKLESGILRECERERVEEIKKEGTQR